jgi:SpoVK/Ycf46/Vps4 family AAA+-type ATPase
VARYRAPSVVFIDEVDSMLTARKADENEASRRMKTEFLVQLDGAGDKSEAHVLLIGATNRPQELDDAARRRFVKRLYVALPETKDREVLLRNLLSKNHHIITDKEFAKLAKNTKGFSGADLKNLCTDAAMGPVRQLGANAMTASADDLPPISYKHCRQSLKSTSPSVAQADLIAYLEWNETYGTKASIPDDIDTESDHESIDEEEEP